MRTIIKNLTAKNKKLEEENKKLKDRIEFALGYTKVVEDMRDDLEKKLRSIEKVCNKFIPDHFKILLIINGGEVEE